MIIFYVVSLLKEGMIFVTSDNNLKFYTIGEEIANSIIHGVGAMLAIAACVILIVSAAIRGGAIRVVSASIYGASLVIMFTMSTLYHALTNDKAKRVFRVFDHTSIFLLIAGTYTPVALITLRGKLGWTIFSIVWGISVLGIVLNSISVEKFKKISLIAYIAMGWCALVPLYSLMQKLTRGGVIFLIIGGVLYTIGVIFYKLKKIKYMHSVWHLFVLGGAIMHYFCVQLYVI